MKAALVLPRSLTPLRSRTDFISYFLLPLLCHSWAKLIGSWLLPGLCVQARGISAWKAPSESECHRTRKGKKKKMQLTAARCIGAPHSQSHSRQECRTQTDTPRKNQPIKPHFDLNTQQSHILTLPDPRRASCFVFPDTDNTAHQEVDTYNTQWRTQGGKTMMLYLFTHKNKFTFFLGDLHQSSIWKNRHTYTVLSGMWAIITWLFCSPQCS